VNKYTVTWIVDGTTYTEEVEYGKVPTFNKSTDKAADAQYTYTFNGWDKEIVAVTGDVTYTAQYKTTVRKYTVIFKYGHNTILPIVVEYGQAATAPSNTDKAPTAQYTYTFDGWDVDFSNITGNLTVTAKYTETVRSYTVTFQYGDGKTETVTVEYGKAATAPTDTAKAATETVTYTFKGWDAEFSEVTADITVNAVYEETPIVVPPTVNTEALQAAIDAYKAAGLDVSAEALTKAEAALNDGSLTQADIDALTAALQAAIDASKETDTAEPDTNEPEDPTEDPTAAPTEPTEDPTDAPTEAPSETETDAPVEGGCGNAWIWIVLVVVIAGAGAAVVIVLLRRKNTADPEPTEPAEEPVAEVEETAEEEKAPVAPLFIPLGEEVPEEEPEIPEDIEIVEEISVEDVDTLMTDKVAEALLEESDELGGSGKMGIINVGVISTAFQAGDVVDLNALQQKGMIDGNVGRLKVLASGTLDKPLTIKAEAFSVQAIKMITLTGGHAVHLNGGK
jgi:ribosomal protein L15